MLHIQANSQTNDPRSPYKNNIHIHSSTKYQNKCGSLGEPTKQLSVFHVLYHERIYTNFTQYTYGGKKGDGLCNTVKLKIILIKCVKESTTWQKEIIKLQLWLTVNLT